MIKLKKVGYADYKVSPTVFPDGTSQVWRLPEYILNHGLVPDPVDIVRIVWRFEAEAEVFHILQLIALLNKEEVVVNLDMEYLPYARQDKAISNKTTFALHVFATALRAYNIHSITVLDAHSDVFKQLSKAPVVSTYYPHPAYRMYDYIVYPDSNAYAKYAAYYAKVPSVVFSKVRDQVSGEITGLEFDSSVIDKPLSKFLIVDDICDGGATFIGVAGELRSVASCIDLYVSHGLFTKGQNAMRKAGIKNFFTTDSLRRGDREEFIVSD